MKPFNFPLKILFTFLSLPIFFPFHLSGQPTSYVPSRWIGITGYYGFIIPHHSYLQKLITSHVMTGEIQWGKSVSGEKYWHRKYAYPQFSFSMVYSATGRNQAIGDAFAVCPNIYLPLHRSRQWTHHFRFSYGIGYLTKHFNRTENYKNLAIGSHWNVFVQLSWLMQWNISSSQKLLTGLGFYHYSNGSIRTPNLGINLPNIKLEYQFHYPVKYKTNASASLLPDSSRLLQYEFYVGGSVKETYPLFGPQYGVFTAGFHLLRRISYKSHIGGGVDLIEDYSLLPALKKKYQRSVSPPEALRAGIALDYEIKAGPWLGFFSTGTYWLDSYKKNGFLYTRTGIGYAGIPHFKIRFLVKTHFFVADYFELCIARNL